MKKALLFLILWITAVYSIQAQNPSYKFGSNYLYSYITIENGLTNNFVDCIYKDSHNFMWIATVGGGLLRHDGYNFVHYNTRTACGIKSNYVRSVCEDNFHRMWVASERGIDVINLDNYEKDELIEESNEIFNKPARKIVKDSHGSIWITTDNSVLRMDFDISGKIANIYTLHPGTTFKNAITALYEYEGQMLAGIDSRVMKITNDNRNNLVAFPFNTAIGLNCTYVKCMIAKEGDLWIGTDNGLYRYNINSENQIKYAHSDSEPNSLSQNMISDLGITDNGILVVATLKGLNFYNSLSDNFFHISQYNGNEAENQTINSDFINCIYCDDHLIWVGTESCGINKIKKPTLSVKNYVPSANDPNSISHGPVNSIYVDDNNVVWVGCVEGGLNRKEHHSSKFTTFTTKNGLPHNSVSFIEPMDSTTLILGTWGGGLCFFDKKKQKVIKNANIDNDSINTSFVGTLYYDKMHNGIWVGTNHGIFFYNNKNSRFLKALPDSINDRIKGCLGHYCNQFSPLVIGTSMGVVIMDIKKAVVENDTIMVKFQIDTPLDGTTEYRNKITCFLPIPESTYYVGTNGYGLVEYQKGSHNYRLNTENGLPNDIIAQILEDNSHNLWLATSNGLCCYSPATGRHANYYKENGLCDNHFFWNASYKREGSNMLYFGTMKGLVEIDIDRSYNTTNINNVIFTSLNINDKDILPGSGGYIEKDISCASEIHINENDKSITIGFSSLNYTNPSLVEYQYRLEGYRDTWTSINNKQGEAVFSSLPQGKYKLQVRCATGSGEYSKPAEIAIIVRGAFYKQWWFIAIILMCLIGTFLWISHMKTANLRKQNEILEDRVNRRTKALETQTEELSRQNEMLFQQNEEIKRQNDEILQQKTKMEQLNSKIQELTIDKLAFFTNITHEFRTPLTLIIGPIERALKLSTNPKVIEQLNFVDHNSKHLLSLVNQLMDFRKVETDNMPISLQNGNFQTFIEDVLLPFRALTQENGVRINLYLHMQSPYIMFDREAMTKIITNLVGNAEKYTPQNGHIDIYAASLVNAKKLYLCVSDSGNGIVEADIERVFNSFYQSKSDDSHSNKPGSGIGLYLCKKLANLLGGDIEAGNKKSHGARFRLTLPLSTQNESPVAVSSFINDVSDGDTSDDETIIDENYRMTVLIVEDNSEMRQYIRTVLSDNYSILEASDGNNAIQVLNSHMVDLILSDMMMPGMNGLELTKAVRANMNFSHIPIIILTAKTSRDTQLECLHVGADDYITKPFDEAMLQAKISSLIENRKNYQKRFQNDMNVESLHIAEDSYDKKFMEKVMKVIKENYKNPEFEVGDLVEAMGVSKTLMNKKMQSLTQQSAGPFIRSYRLKVAHDLIIKNRITHNMNISEIAYEVGFNDPKYFTRCFTKQYNATPSSIMDNGAGEN